jgi:DNA-directed RNA polymerase subunit RPC12/RpoP
MLEFLGSQPDGRKEYKCSECKRDFEIRGWKELVNADDPPDEELEDPTWCPYCGTGATK